MRSATAALRLTSITKRYGRTVALDGLDLEVPAGVICGLVGPNGAGKTTTFGVVGGFIRPQSGQVDLFGEGPFKARRHRGRLTLLPQDCELNPHTPVAQLLRYYGRLQGLGPGPARVAAERILDQVALEDRAGARIRELSHGMRRRVQVAQALLGDPELVLLDEPTSGLDPELVVHMRRLFAAQRGRCTLVISSHNLAELEAVCDHVIFIRDGRRVSSGSLAEITGRGTMVRYLLETAVQPGDPPAELSELSLQWEGTALCVTGPSNWSVSAINSQVIPWLLAAGCRLLEVRQGHSLEDAYMGEHGKVSAAP